MRNRYIVLTAQFISLLFTPFYLPVVAFAALFVFSYLNLLPLAYKLVFLLLVYCFTAAMPSLSIYVYRKINGWTRHELGRQEKRIVPYVISITCYTSLLYLMQMLHMPRFTLAIIVAALAIQVLCALLNVWIKISTHSAAAGGVVGALTAFASIFGFDPTAWLCLTILLAGAVCSARLILRQHTLQEVGLGVLVGLICGWSSVILM